MIQASKLEPRITRYELGNYEWRIIKPLLPNKPRGIPRVNDRRVFNKIKQCRRIATRYDKLAANYLAADYLAFIKLASIRVWLRVYESAPSSSGRNVRPVQFACILIAR